MGMAEHYRERIRQKEKRWGQFVERLALAGMPPASQHDFAGDIVGEIAIRPSTRKGWAIYEALLDSEGVLDVESREEIKRGLERIDISEREVAIRARLSAGGTLPDPSNPGSSQVISGKIGLTVGAMGIVHWTAIQELGLGEDGFYDAVARRASLEMYEIAQRRGDFKDLFKSSGPEDIESRPEDQSLTVPDDFVPVEILIRHDWMKNAEHSMAFIRYDPEHGLVQGHVRRYSEYDRGAGGFMSGRGALVTWFLPEVDVLLANINMRKFKGLSRRGLWWVAGDPAVIIGRNRSKNAIRSALSCHHRFHYEDDARKWLEGTIDSYFVRETIPVSVEKHESEYRLRFSGRLLNGR